MKQLTAERQDHDLQIRIMQQIQQLCWRARDRGDCLTFSKDLVEQAADRLRRNCVCVAQLDVDAVFKFLHKFDGAKQVS